ncbi:MAG: type I secretion system permease/ATPase [Methylobacteriaceae bacterium]|jgi:PrtD family type I secretion system ABC transporter|nr:type I secretion system permease/ATPase [Methylobacteriaceae bacterium]
MAKESAPEKAREDNILSVALASLRKAFVVVMCFSGAVNILMLTGSVFMLQVYDRVLASRSVPTLVALAGIAVAMYAFLGLFDFFRSRVTSRAGYWLDGQLGSALFRTWLARSLAVERGDAARPLSDIGIVRQFIASPGLTGLMDLPWTPFYLLILYWAHYKLFLLAFCGMIFISALAVANEYLTHKNLGRAMIGETLENRFLEQSYRNAESILPMGMMVNVENHWLKLHNDTAALAQRGAETGARFSSVSRTFRMILQSALLGFGAYLAILQEVSSGMIIAGSIIGGRALAPVDQVIAQWRTISRARHSYNRLKQYLAAVSANEHTLRLPEPTGALTLQNVGKFAPDAAATDGGRRLLLNNITFSLEPGDALGVIGPSASGKTVLARVIVGAWAHNGGSVRLDGAALEHWDSELLGRYVGYLPQNVELMAGSVQQNIARFDPEARDEDIITAAQIAGVHQMILNLPNGYATMIGYGATPLSGGQTQRIGLARALYRLPKLVVLDEPNANLDMEGDNALTAAIQHMRELKSVVVVMAHRPSAIAAVNKLLVISNGSMVQFGDKESVLAQMTRSAP